MEHVIITLGNGDKHMENAVQVKRGRPNGEPKTVVTVRLTPSIYGALLEKREEGENVQAVVVRILRSGVR